MGKKITIIAITFAVLAVTQPAYAQQSGKVWRIGTLFSGSPATHGHYVDWFRQGLRDLGYVEGRNYVLVSRWGMGKRKQLPALAAELVEAKADVILTSGGTSIRAVGKATRTIPIVVGSAGQLGSYGFVASFSRPGGNVTGSTFNTFALNGKRLGLLREALPDARRVAFLYSRSSKRSVRYVKRVDVAGKALGLKVQPLKAGTLKEIKGAFVSMVRDRADALIIHTDPGTNFHRKPLTALAIARKIPTMCEQVIFALSGCLMSYAVDRQHMLHRAASFVDRILKGARPADLPVELATRYKLVVNLKTAKALGITLPPSILLQATEVIE